MATSPTNISHLRLSQERPAHTFNGYVMLLVLLLTVVVDTIAFLIELCGFYLLQPNTAAALLLRGDYKGSDRTTGLRWRWPWLTRSKLSPRVHNVTSEKLKVNDLRGNPIA